MGRLRDRCQRRRHHFASLTCPASRRDAARGIARMLGLTLGTRAMDSGAYVPFAPLPGARHGPPLRPRRNTVSEPVGAPVPDGAEDPACAATRLYGQAPGQLWRYNGADGQILHAIARWDKPQGKDISLWPGCAGPDGSQSWCFEHYPFPRPVYTWIRSLRVRKRRSLCVRVRRRPTRQALIFPDWIATTSSGGAHGATHADWSCLRGRRAGDRPRRQRSTQQWWREIRRRLCAGSRKASLPV